MMKTYTNEYLAWTLESLEKTKAFEVEVNKLFKDCIAEGYNPRELVAMLVQSVDCIASQYIIKFAMEK